MNQVRFWRRLGVVLSVLWFLVFGGWMWVSNVNSVNESYGNALQHCVDLADMRGERERERYATEAEQRGLAAADRARMKKQWK
jgi:putative IMPACT (imprinted ancient) family translation regulator